MMSPFKKIFLSSVISASLLLTGCGAGTETTGQEGAQTNQTINELLDTLQGLVNGNNAGQINVDTTGSESIVITIPRTPAEETNPDTGPVLPLETYIVAVTDSNNDGHIPLWTLDSNLAAESRWSAQPVNDVAPWIQYELSNAITLDSVQIAFFLADVRATTFQIETSVNGTNWDVALLETSSGKAESYESFSFEARPAKFVRLIGFGNTNSPWTSILEMNIPGVTLTDSIVIPETTQPLPVDTVPPVTMPELPDDLEPEVTDPVVVIPPVIEIPQVEPPVVVVPPVTTGGTLIANAQQLQDALAAAKGGEVFLLKDGNYGSLVISRQFPNYVTLRALNQHKAVFSSIEISGANRGFVHFDRIQSSGIRAVNGAHHLKYTNSRFSSTVYFKTAADVIIDNNIIDVDGELHALLMNSVSRFELTRNFIARAQEDLMRLTGDSDGGLILNNVFYDTMPQNIPHDGNVCEYNHSDALQMFGANNKNPRNLTIRGNYFYDDPSNNQIRPESCVSGKTGVNLNMQGIFMSDPQGDAYENILVEENIAYLGSANSILINGATNNVVIRNNTLLPWTEGRGGSIRIVEVAKRTNKGLAVYGNTATAVSVETTSLSNGLDIHGNLVYDKSDAAPMHRNKLFQGGGEGSKWQYFLPVTGSAVDFGSTYGAQKRLQELMQSDSSTMPVQFQ